jgi:cytochrome P450
MGPYLQLGGQGWLHDPYPVYHRLREEDPVHWSEELGHWLLTRYRDVVFVLRDRRFSAANRPPQRRWGRPTTMVNADPPEHARLRRVAAAPFNHQAVEAMRPAIQEAVDSLLEGLEGQVDLAERLATPLPLLIIGRILGLSERARDVLMRELVAFAPGAGRRRAGMMGDAAPPSPDDSYWRSVVEEHRASPGEDLVCQLIAARQQGLLHDDEELVDTLVLLYVAGMETTIGLIGNGLLALLRHPDQWQRLCRDPRLARQAVEEALRYDPPVHGVSRRALADVEVGGRTIRRGEKVLCLLAAANRDPEVFPDPDRFDIGRAQGDHLAFGTGVHTCLGALLARAEGEVAIATLARRFPDLRLAGEPRIESNLIVRRVTSLPVSL